MSEMKVSLIDHMGSDLSVVNAARASFGKESKWIKTSACGITRKPEDGYRWPGCGSDERSCCGNTGRLTRSLSAADTKLIGYLARENHWSPFAHAFLSFKIKAPIFVARQLQKHTVGLAWNEESRRYVDSEPEFYEPKQWRKRPDGSIKQGSGDEIFISGTEHSVWTHNEGWQDVETLEWAEHALAAYNALLKEGVAPEMARMVLPQSTMTTWVWSGSLYAFARVCKLRLDSHAQKETREIAAQLEKFIAPLFPVSWAALRA